LSKHFAELWLSYADVHKLWRDAKFPSEASPKPLREPICLRARPTGTAAIGGEVLPQISAGEDALDEKQRSNRDDERTFRLPGSSSQFDPLLPFAEILPRSAIALHDLHPCAETPPTADLART
jgi:hypothetical protein